MAEERIGNYRVHPVASMFPLMEGGLYEEFKGTIEAVGQNIDPIIVQGDVLLDGRNRLRACLELGIEPRVEEYQPPITKFGKELEASNFIRSKNLDRRNLTPDQRVSIAAQIHAWRMEERARQRKAEGGKKAGRGRPEKADTKSYPAIDEPKTRAKNERSTVGQIAVEAKVSYHKAAQALTVAKIAPQELTVVSAGKLSLNEAYKLVMQVPVKRSESSAAARHARTERESADAFIETLRKEIARKRLEIEGRRSKIWSPEGINKLELVKLLDWVEGALRTRDCGAC